MARDFVGRHGCRDLGLVQGLGCQGSATGDPCNSRSSTFFPQPVNERNFHGLCVTIKIPRTFSLLGCLPHVLCTRNQSARHGVP